jgi:hypothetical protein
MRTKARRCLRSTKGKIGERSLPQRGLSITGSEMDAICSDIAYGSRPR